MNADALAALLVRDGVLSQEAVDEALARQVLSGGTLDTALLELGLLDEKRLLAVLPQAYGTRAVGRPELSAIDRAVTSVFPRRLAEKHGVVPIDVSGRRLTVALAGPPDLALLDEIGFMLSVYVKPAVTLQARIAWALARLYGITVPPRLDAVLARLGDEPTESKAAVEAWHAQSLHKMPTKTAPTSGATAVDARSPDGSGWSVGNRAGLPANAPSTPRLGVENGGTIEANAVAAQQQAAKRAQAQSPERTKEERRRSERVLWTVDDAIAELALADDRDAMLDVVLRFAYRRLSTVAVFILTRAQQGPAFVGWDVIDPLLGKSDIATFALPAEGAHGLGQMLAMRSPFLGPLKREDPLVRLFGRRARAVILLPITVGDRFVGAIYGDCGTRPIPPSSLAELHMVVPRLAKGLANLILRKKKAQRAAAAAPSLFVAPTLLSPSLVPTAAASVANDQPAAHQSAAAAFPVVAAPLGVSGDAVGDDIVIDEPPARTSVAGVLAEVEEDIAVAAKAPARAVPAIDLDIDIIDVDDTEDGVGSNAAASAATAPPATAAEGSAPIIAPTLLTSALPAPPVSARVYSWADGKDDDEDVRLDPTAVAALEELRSVPSSTPLDLGIGAQLAAGLDLTPPPLDPSAIAPSPGARGRESLLVATHTEWLAHEDVLLDELVGQLHRPGEAQRRSAMAAVLAHGERALPSLARYFPGVLTVHPFGAMEARPDVEELSDCLACLVRLGADAAAPILTAELVHDDRLHRWTAVWALSTLQVPGALPRLAQRIFDPEPAIAALALEVLDVYRDDAAFAKVMAQVRDLVRRGDTFQRERAIMAVGELRDRDAMPALVDLLGTRPKEIADDARRALVEISKQDFGTAERRWRAWIADNERTPRTRWLIDGLGSKDDEIRKSAQAELNRVTGQFFGFRWDAPRADRDGSLQAWLEWWQTQEREAPGRWP